MKSMIEEAFHRRRDKEKDKRRKLKVPLPTARAHRYLAGVVEAAAAEAAVAGGMETRRAAAAGMTLGVTTAITVDGGRMGGVGGSSSGDWTDSCAGDDGTRGDDRETPTTEGEGGAGAQEDGAWTR